MQLRKMSRSRIAWGIMIVWTLSCASAACIRVNAILSQTGPSDVYDKTWVYQLLVFCLTRLPYWLAALVLLLIIALTKPEPKGEE